MLARRSFIAADHAGRRGRAPGAEPTQCTRETEVTEETSLLTHANIASRGKCHGAFHTLYKFNRITVLAMTSLCNAAMNLCIFICRKMSTLILLSTKIRAFLIPSAQVSHAVIIYLKEV